MSRGRNATLNHAKSADPSWQQRTTELGRVASDTVARASEAGTKIASFLGGWASKAVSRLSQQAGGGTVVIEGVKFAIQRKIAEGGFSTVYTVAGPDGKVLALKRCLVQNRETLQDVKREIFVHKQVLHSAALLRLVASQIGDSPRVPRAKEALLLFPLYAGGSVADILEESSGARCQMWPFPEHIAARLFIAVLRGASALHCAGFRHGDIKPHNILLDSRDLEIAKPVLMDLGSCTKLSMKIKTRSEALLLQDQAATKCSAPYRAPELYDVPSPGIIDAKADVWSLGATLYAMTFGSGWSPFEDERQGVLTLAILNAQVSFPNGHSSRHAETFSRELEELVALMLRRDPSLRCEVKDAAMALADLTKRSNLTQ